MPIFAPLWSSNTRVRAAAINAPGMKAFDPDRVGVTLLQRALADTGIAPTIKVDGIYGQQTAGAVKAVQKRFALITATHPRVHESTSTRHATLIRS